MKKLARIGMRAGAAALALTGLVGVLHLPFASRLLRAISPASLCPITHGTPDQIDRAQAAGAATLQAESLTAAPARPALGFVLDRSTRADLVAWAKTHGVTCADLNGNANLQRCLDVPASAIGENPATGPLEEMTFTFRSTGEMTNIETLRRGLAPARAAAIAGELEANLERVLGAPTKSGGAATEAHLSRGGFVTYVVEHGFHDYHATVSATNIPGTGVMVREQYFSVRLS